MKLTRLLSFLGFSLIGVQAAYAAEISSVSMTGEKEALIRIQADEEFSESPKLEIKNAEILFFIRGATLDPEMKGHVLLISPHPLIEKGEFEEEKSGVSAHLWINGSEKDLAARTTAKLENGQLVIRIAFPAGASPTLEMLKDEQKPLSVNAVHEDKTKFPGYYLWVVCLVIGGAATGSYFFIKFIKRRGLQIGKKYLIEQLAYMPMGNRSGVSLVKVGREFFLIGVTPHAINLVSHLPMLQAQYEEESKFERASFHDEVQSEIDRLKKEIAL